MTKVQNRQRNNDLHLSALPKDKNEKVGEKLDFFSPTFSLLTHLHLSSPIAEIHERRIEVGSFLFFILFKRKSTSYRSVQKRISNSPTTNQASWIRRNDERVVSILSA